MRWMYFVKPSWRLDSQITYCLIGLVLMLYLLPLRWLSAALIAASIHELGHYCSVFLLGGKVNSLTIGPNGAIMKAAGLTTAQELISLVSGPLAGFLPLLVYRQFPVTAFCGVIQSVYNLLPIYPLDGGKILRYIIHSFGGSDRILYTIEYSALFALTLLCLYIWNHFHISIFLLLIGLLFRKIPCKQCKD